MGDSQSIQSQIEVSAGIMEILNLNLDLTQYNFKVGLLQNSWYFYRTNADFKVEWRSDDHEMIRLWLDLNLSVETLFITNDIFVPTLYVFRTETLLLHE